MTKDEFREWLRHHRNAFTRLADQFAKLGDGQTATVDAWYNVLAYVELDDAKAATDAMLSGKVQLPKYLDLDDHPRIVKRAAAEISRRAGRTVDRAIYVDGEKTVRCVLCNDMGVVSCWHPMSVRAAITGTLGEQFTVYSCAYRCPCDTNPGRRWMTTYDPEKHLIIDKPYKKADADERARFVAWANERAAALAGIGDDF